MPQSIVRFLRVYASVVMLLITGVVAIGTEPAAAPADFGNVEAAVAHYAHSAPLRAKRTFSFDGNGRHASFSFANEAMALADPLPLATPRTGHASTICAQRGLRIRHPS